MKNTLITKAIAWGGCIVAGVLCLFDIITSVMGVRSMVGTGDGSFIALSMPVLFGVLAFGFNALSSLIFRIYLKKGFSAISFMIVFLMWVLFLAYDALSAFIGILGIYTMRDVNSWESLRDGMGQLGAVATVLIIGMSLLLAFGPFLLTLFAELTTVTDEDLAAEEHILLEEAEEEIMPTPTGRRS